MKKIFTLNSLIIASIFVQAQRYNDKIFSNVTIDSVVYGNAADWAGTAQDLKMNIFQPQGDTVPNRPVLVLAHGGSFINGSRYSPDIAYLCTEFAKRGYVCVSIQYRLGVDLSKFFSEPGPQFANAVWRATLDGRAAIRYLRANAATYNINPDNVYMGGVSAGGALSLHLAFLDLESEVTTANPPLATITIGGIEGKSGTPGRNWRARAIINLCGGLGDTKWMINNRDIAIFSVHGTNDETVPYKSGSFSAFNINIAKVDGSFIVDSIAKSLGMKSVLYTFKSAPHVPFVPGIGTPEQSTAYMDPTENLLRDFLLTEINRPLGLNDVLTGADIQLFPNPASNYTTVKLNKGLKSTVQLYDTFGKLIDTKNFSSTTYDFEFSSLSSGVYILTVSNEFGSVHKKLYVN